MTLPVSCASCGGELHVRYEGVDHDRLDGAPGIFRYSSRLPVQDLSKVVSLGEGSTPLVAVVGARRRGLPLPKVSIKCESANPTGSFKDRIAAVAATIMAERDIPGCVGTSSGNSGAAMAAFHSIGAPFGYFWPLTPCPKSHADHRSRCCLTLLEGLGHDPGATELALQEVVKATLDIGYMPFITASALCPKPWKGPRRSPTRSPNKLPTPPAVYVPIGGGGLFSALWRGYSEIGGSLPNGPPRLVAVQPSGCPTVSRLQAGLRPVVDGPVGASISGLQVAFLFEPRGVKAALQTSRGHTSRLMTKRYGDPGRPASRRRIVR